MGDATASSDEDRLAPLVGLVERLRAGVTELQGRWEALGKELEAKRGRLGSAEASLELVNTRQDEAASGQQEQAAEGGGLRAEDQQCVSQAAQVCGWRAPPSPECDQQ
jgi:chromosome segregation ATPase